MIPTWLHVLWSVVSLACIVAAAAWTLLFVYPSMRDMRRAAIEGLELNRMATQVFSRLSGTLSGLDKDRLEALLDALEAALARLERLESLASAKTLFGVPARFSETSHPSSPASHP